MGRKIVIKVNMTCDKCRSKAMALSASLWGVDSVRIAGVEKDQLVVVGSGVDAIRLVAALRKKLMTHAFLVEVGEAREAGAVVVNTQEAQPAYEPANVRRRSGIQSMITKLTSKLFMWPHDDIRRISSPSPPSSPPQHVEHTANLPPAESRVPSSYVLAVCKTAPPATEEELELLRDQHDQDSVDALQERVAMLHIDDEDGI
nr:unnamed protein product [Digitaria exilis]